MKSLFDESSYQEICNRLANLSESQSALWGKMDVGQMLHHCQFPILIALQKDSRKFKSSFILRLFKKSLYNDKPWRKNLPTTPVFKVKDTKNFSTERDALLKLVEEFHNKKTQKEWHPHPVFGSFTAEQWGKMQYKHLDHHLKQFNA